MDTSSFEGLIPRPTELAGAPFLFYSPRMAQFIISTLLPSLTTESKVSNIVRLINEAFQCSNAFSLDLRKIYDQIFHLLCLRRRFLTLEGALQKLSPNGSINSELGAIGEQLNLLEVLLAEDHE